MLCWRRALCAVTAAMNKPRRYPGGGGDRRCTGRKRPAYHQAPRRGEYGNDRKPWRLSAVAATPGNAGEFVPEGRLLLRQVVHGLHQGGCALPRLVANAHGAMRRDGGDEQTVTISVRW
jgi:hypothetical protein